MRLGRLEVRDGFFVTLAALHLADGAGVLPLFLLAAALHELGHALTLYLAGGRLDRLTLTACGAVMRCRLPEGRCARAAVCLAGPAASFLLAAAAMAAGAYVLAGASVLLGLFNLLPMPPLDGGMALAHLLDGRLPRARRGIALAAALAVLALGLGLARIGGGVWLLLIGIAVSVQAGKSLAKRPVPV